MDQIKVLTDSVHTIVNVLFLRLGHTFIGLAAIDRKISRITKIISGKWKSLPDHKLKFLYV